MRTPLATRYLPEPYYYYLVEKSKLPLEEVAILIEECLKMLILLPYTKWFIPVSSQVDEIWHLMLLETKSYQDLCLSLPAKEFIHHQSILYINIKGRLEKKNFHLNMEEKQQIIEEKISWLLSYVTNFGNFTEEAVIHWNWAREIMDTMKISLAELNQMLRKTQLLEER